MKPMKRYPEGLSLGWRGFLVVLALSVVVFGIGMLLTYCAMRVGILRSGSSDEVYTEPSTQTQLHTCQAHKAMCEDELEQVKGELDAEIADLAWCYAQMEVLEWSEEQCYEDCGEDPPMLVDVEVEGKKERVTCLEAAEMVSGCDQMLETCCADLCRLEMKHCKGECAIQSPECGWCGPEKKED